MSLNTALAAPAAAPSQSDAAALVDRIVETIDRLQQVLLDETEMIRGAKLADAAALVEQKTAASGAYQRELEAVKAAAGVIGRLVPERADILRRKLVALQDTVAVNLAVVATAKAVAEDMMRSVAEEMARRDRPQTYAPPTTRAARPAAAGPMSISRRS